MSTKPLHRAILLALAAPLVLVACGGGGGGMVRSSPPPAAPLAPPPPASGSTTVSYCPSRPTADCVVTRPGNLGNVYWYDNVISNFSLIKRGDHYIDVRNEQSQFVGGTRIEAGGMIFREGTTLTSNARVLPGAWLAIEGTLIGDATTEAHSGEAIGGELVLRGTIRGNVLNQGHFDYGIHDPQYTASRPTNRLEGNFKQTANGTLNVALPYLDYANPLTITGRADLAGTLNLYGYVSWDTGPYPFPSSPTAILVLHADGGVFGAFDRWTSPGLFVEGGLRYGPNDAWFDLTRISMQSAMSGQGFGGITLASAGNLDRAMAIADGFAAAPNAAQARFLRSAGRLLWLDDATQAARSLDSLSGREHAWLATDVQQRASAAAGELALRAGLRRMDGRSSHWSQPLANGHSEGDDQWIGARTLLGGSVTREMTNADGADTEEQRASLYLHRRSDRWFGTLVASAGRSNGLLQRRIDLGDGLAHVAGSRRRVELGQLHAELARPLAFAGGQLQPYAAVDAGLVRGGGFIEQGDTGLELASDGGALHQVGAALGLRYAREWRIGTQQVRLSGQLQGWQQLHAGGQWQAAFIAIPEASFGLRDWGQGRTGLARLSFEGGTGHGWQWALSGQRDGDRFASTHWQLRFARDF